MHRLQASREHLYSSARGFLKTHGFRPTQQPGTFVRRRVATQLVDRILLPIDVEHDLRLSCTVNISVGCQSEDWSNCEKPDLYVSTNIGALMPGHRWHTWSLSCFGAVRSAEFDPIAVAVEQYGLPWLTKFRCPEDVRLASRQQGAYCREAPIWSADDDLTYWLRREKPR